MARTSLDLDLGRGAARIQKLLELFNTSGERASQMLYQSGVCADTNTITIGADVLEIDTMTHDSTETVGLAGVDNVTDPVNVPTTTAHALVAGQMVLIGTEVLLITYVPDTLSFVAKRARCGTTIGAHVSTDKIYDSVVTATRLPLPIASTAATDLLTALEAEINAGDRGTVITGIKAVSAVKLSAAHLMIAARERGALALATTETLANGAWQAAAMAGGKAASRGRVAVYSHVPTANEATLTAFSIPVDFDPIGVLVRVVVTADGKELETAAANAVQKWDGAITITAAAAPKPAYVTLTDGTTVKWTAAHTVYIMIYE
jgi:hypothetical protein